MRNLSVSCGSGMSSASSGNLFTGVCLQVSHGSALCEGRSLSEGLCGVCCVGNQTEDWREPVGESQAGAAVFYFHTVKRSLQPQRFSGCLWLCPELGLWPVSHGWRYLLVAFSCPGWARESVSGEHHERRQQAAIVSTGSLQGYHVITTSGRSCLERSARPNGGFQAEALFRHLADVPQSRRYRSYRQRSSPASGQTAPSNQRTSHRASPMGLHREAADQATGISSTRPPALQHSRISMRTRLGLVSRLKPERAVNGVRWLTVHSFLRGGRSYAA